MPNVDPPSPELLAAVAYVETMFPRADGYRDAARRIPWWYGWALRDAYLAGVKAERERCRAVLRERLALYQHEREREQLPVSSPSLLLAAKAAAAVAKCLEEVGPDPA